MEVENRKNSRKKPGQQKVFLQKDLESWQPLIRLRKNGERTQITKIKNGRDIATDYRNIKYYKRTPWTMVWQQIWYLDKLDKLIETVTQAIETDTRNRMSE